MGLIGSRLSLTQRCSIERDVATAAGWGEAATPDWDDVAEDVPCRAWVSSGREESDEHATVAVEDIRLICALGTDVTTSDRIGDVTLRGTVMLAGPLGVRAVLPRRDHLELVLVRLG